MRRNKNASPIHNRSYKAEMEASFENFFDTKKTNKEEFSDEDDDDVPVDFENLSDTGLNRKPNKSFQNSHCCRKSQSSAPSVGFSTYRSNDSNVPKTP